MTARANLAQAAAGAIDAATSDRFQDGTARGMQLAELRVLFYFLRAWSASEPQEPKRAAKGDAFRDFRRAAVAAPKAMGANLLERACGIMSHASAPRGARGYPLHAMP